MDNTERINEFKARQRKALERMKAVYDETKEAVKLVYQGEDSPMDVLTSLYTDYGFDGENDTLGEYFFRTLPVSGDEMAYLTGIHTFMEGEEIEKENISGVLIALNLLNYYIPFGNFAMDPDDGGLTFKMTIPVYSDQSEDELYRQLDVLIGHCMHVTGQFAESLIQLSRGQMDVEDFLELFEE